jgi:membrane protein implicated in regulation of membrane protease activity
MGSLVEIFIDHAFLAWMAIAALLLTIELLTGSGWLLWPAGSAALVGVINAGPDQSLPAQAATFAALTAVSTFVGRRWLRRSSRRGGHDPNDPLPRLIGRKGEAASTFEGGRGRVFVDGKEWAAELVGDGALAPGSRVEVVDLLGGARLKVRAS